MLEGTQHGKGAVEGAVGVGQLREGEGSSQPISWRVKQMAPKLNGACRSYDASTPAIG